MVSVLFHSPSGVLFTFPSRYLFTIDLAMYLALERDRPRFPPDFKRARWYSGTASGSLGYFAYRALTVSGRPFQERSTITKIFYSP